MAIKYPIDIENRTHLDISAWEYSLPNLKEVNASGLSTADIRGSQGSQSELQRQAANAATGAAQDPSVARRNGTKPIFRVKIYIPGGFGEHLSSNWENESIAFIGDAGKIEDLGSAVGAIWDVGNAAIQQRVTNFMMRKRDSIFGGAAESIQASLGRRVAPIMAKVFKSSEGRILPLSFSFSPQSIGEGDSMIRIVNEFRNAVLPGFDSFITQGIIQVFKYPPLFDIKVINGQGPSDTAQSVKSGTFFQYRDMALTSFDISYSDDTPIYTYFRDGTPTSARLNLNFESIFPAFKASDGANIKLSGSGPKNRDASLNDRDAFGNRGAGNLTTDVLPGA